jgi:hypothetical protein
VAEDDGIASLIGIEVDQGSIPSGGDKTLFTAVAIPLGLKVISNFRRVAKAWASIFVQSNALPRI